MIKRIGDLFALSTDSASCCFKILPTGQLEHLFYGKRINFGDDGRLLDLFAQDCKGAAGGSIAYDDASKFSLDGMSLESSGRGKGDAREPFVEVENADGSMTTDFVFESADVDSCPAEMRTLPSSRGCREHLCVTLKDKNFSHILRLHWNVYPECDVITRRAEFTNGSGASVRLRRLMSAQIDFEGDGFVAGDFSGSWAHEMNLNFTPLASGRHVVESSCGVSSSSANPFVMLGRGGVSQDSGECWGFNLVYSGNHYECFDVESGGRLRFVNGINPKEFSFSLAPGETFESPESVASYSDNGWNRLSRNLHRFARLHIARGEWSDRERPILLNSWEAAYFDIDQMKLLSLAEKAAAAGVELFVVDDGWFKGRTDDTRALGDWDADEGKFPGGLAPFVEKIKSLGMKAGLWVEPEMVSAESELFKAHGDWALDIPGKGHSEGRRQRMLDLANPSVQDFIIEKMSEVFSQADISYVKWDMNRAMSDVYSRSLSRDRQGEAAHRHTMGFYRVAKALVEKFPHILFEGCASGGNRFDLGALCVFPQIWASDCTDALRRVSIQEGYSYGYPQSAFSAHVSASPNHQTGRASPLETRFNVACFASFGYEMDLRAAGKGDLEKIKRQISFYKKWRGLFQFGQLRRSRCGDLVEWTVASEDSRRAAAIVFRARGGDDLPLARLFPRGLDPSLVYSVGVVDSGGERALGKAGGDALMAIGARIEPGLLRGDLSSAMFLLEAEDGE